MTDFSDLHYGTCPYCKKMFLQNEGGPLCNCQQVMEETRAEMEEDDDEDD
jgi:hypothetical protein